MEGDKYHALKSVHTAGVTRTIVLQNKNGPCPLVAASNCLLLRGNLKIPDAHVKQMRLPSSVLAEMLANYLFDIARKLESSGEASGHVEHVLAESVALLPRLQHGMDLNLGFSSPSSCELTAELQLVELLGLRILHAWVMGGGTREELQSLGISIETLTYNKATELAVSPMTPGVALFCTEGSQAAPAAAMQSSSADGPIASVPPSLPTYEQHLGNVYDKPGTESHSAKASGGTVPSHPDESTSGIPAAAGSASGVVSVEESKPGIGSSRAAAPFEPPRAPQRQDVPLLSSSGSTPSTQPATGSAATERSAARRASSGPQAEANGAAAASSGTDTGLPPPAEVSGSGSASESKSPRIPRSVQSEAVGRFLRETAGQITMPGLVALQNSLAEHDVAVFFRNLHYNTMTVHKGRVFLLVTDQGLAQGAPSVVWERLDDIKGDTTYCNGNFEPIHQSSGVNGVPGAAQGGAPATGHSTHHGARPGRPPIAHARPRPLPNLGMPSHASGYQSSAGPSYPGAGRAGPLPPNPRPGSCIIS